MSCKYIGPDILDYSSRVGPENCPECGAKTEWMRYAVREFHRSMGSVAVHRQRLVCTAGEVAPSTAPGVIPNPSRVGRLYGD